MKVAIAGGDGFIGRELSRQLVEAGDEVTWLSYRPKGNVVTGVTEVPFDPQDSTGPWAQVVASSEAVVNLSGYPIVVRWSEATKKLLVSSRVDTARALIAAISAARSNSNGGPKVYIGASGIGAYGDRGDDILTEDEPYGSDWLSQLAQTWEGESMKAVAVGCRTAVIRTGLVLGKEGLMPRVALPMKLFVGGPLGNGRQWMSWLHHKDIAGIYAWTLKNESLSGPINACAPEPARSRDFAKALGRVLRRPSWIPAPKFGIKIILGEVAEYMLYSQRASAQKLISSGYSYFYPELEDALRAAADDL